jgi:hypothetical protein
MKRIGSCAADNARPHKIKADAKTRKERSEPKA